MENLKDKILEEYGLHYEDLNIEERETYNSSYFNLKTLSIEDIKNYISDMKNSIALQLTDIKGDEFEKNIILKARLKNYLLLEAFLTAPDKAEKALRESLAKTKKK